MKLLKSAFLFSLATVFAFGLSIAFTPEANASGSCPPCYINPGSSGWSLYDSCIDYSDPHCPLFYRTYQNNSTGQICRGKIAVANV